MAEPFAVIVGVSNTFVEKESMKKRMTQRGNGVNTVKFLITYLCESHLMESESRHIS